MKVQSLQLLLGLLQSLGDQLDLGHQQRLRLHEDLVLLVLRLGEVLEQQAGHGIASLVDAAFQHFRLLQLLQQLLSFIFYILLK